VPAPAGPSEPLRQILEARGGGATGEGGAEHGGVHGGAARGEVCPGCGDSYPWCSALRGTSLGTS